MTLHDAAGDPQQIITDLERKLAESVAQQAAATEVLQIINGSGGDLTPVLDVVVTKAAELCDATGGGLYLVEGDMTLNYGGTTSCTGAAQSKLMGVPLASILGLNPQDRPFVHVVDLKATKAYRNGVPFIVASVARYAVMAWRACHQRRCYRRGIGPFSQGSATVFGRPNQAPAKLRGTGIDRERAAV